MTVTITGLLPSMVKTSKLMNYRKFFGGFMKSLFTYKIFIIKCNNKQK